MTLWVLKGGRVGERERRMLEESVLAIGWSELPDLSTIADRIGLEEHYRRTYPDAPPNRVSNHVDQLHEFLHGAAEGELVIMPIKGQLAVAVGEIAGGYEHRGEAGHGMTHVRPVRWLRSDIAREAFGPEFSSSFEAFLTFCRADGEEETVRKIVSEGATAEIPARKPRETAERPARGRGAREIERDARHQILSSVHRRYGGPRLADLVEEILRVQGFHTHRPDFQAEGGIDILAAPGPCNPGAPGLLVHTRISEEPVTVDTYESLMERMESVRAEQGVILALGGFDDEVGDRVRDSFFRVRLWDGAELLDALFSTYESLPAAMRGQIPLRRIWVLGPSGRRRGS